MNNLPTVRKKVEVKVMLEPGMRAVVPEYKTPEAAGADVRVVFDPGSSNGWSVKNTDEEFHAFYCMAPGETKLFQLGFRVEIPPGWELQLRSRSGMAKRGIFVINSPGTIDSDYRGPMMVLLHNASGGLFYINHNDRVAQVVLKRAPQADFVLADSLNDTERGEGGFGSTGVK